MGLDRIELSTSPLSGVRSSQLSYRPKFGGAGRDRTGDLLNANQALSQLSYSPLIHKISNRGRLDADRKTSSRPIKERFIELEKRETEAPNDPRTDHQVWTEKASAYLIQRLRPLSLRKEVIQPQVLLRLPCYDFTPIMDHTLGRCPPCGSACGLLVQSTFVM